MITINNKNYEGENINVKNDQVSIDGNPLEETFTGVLRIEVKGNIQKLETTSDVKVVGDVGSITAGGNVKCESVAGNISARGSISCRNVAGGINSGNINIGSNLVNVSQDINSAPRHPIPPTPPMPPMPPFPGLRNDKFKKGW